MVTTHRTELAFTYYLTKHTYEPVEIAESEPATHMLTQLSNESSNLSMNRLGFGLRLEFLANLKPGR